MFENEFRAIDWARVQGFTLNAVLLRLVDGRKLLYYPQLDEANIPTFWYPMNCWEWVN